MIFYCGNMLSKKGFNKTTIESLGPKLKEEYEVIMVSDKKNKILRLGHMLFIFLNNIRHIKVVIIDTYNHQALYYAWIISLVCVICRKPFLPILHSGDLMIKRNYKIDYILKKSAQIISPSRYLAEKIKNDKVKIIPNFINVDFYNFKIRKKLVPRILWVRSFHTRYAPGLAVEILFHLRERYPNVILSMVGPDKGEAQFIKEKIKKYNLWKVVEIVGGISKEEWIDKSKNFDLFLNTSKIDNQPISLMEAMALGLPIVSSKVGDIPNMIDSGKEGLLVNSQNVLDYVEAITFLISNPSLMESISVGARRKAERYDWKNVKPLWKELLDEYL